MRQTKKRGSDEAQRPFAAKRDYRFHAGWVGPRFKAFVATGIIFALFFLLSGMLVVFHVVRKEEMHFSPPEPIPRPNVLLKKLNVPVQVKTEDQEARTLRERQVADEIAPEPAAAPVERPKMKLKKPQVLVRKSAKPKT
ncbi:hypothetical protein, partial [Pontiella sp.]|uniref:hypothetical protein n=1 Tax=Pontiella sp. TaxID=2837462 RepID=UPI00356B26E0